MELTGIRSPPRHNERRKYQELTVSVVAAISIAVMMHTTPFIKVLGFALAFLFGVDQILAQQPKKEVSIVFEDGTGASDVEIQLQYPSGPHPFRTKTDASGVSVIDREQFGYVVVKYRREDYWMTLGRRVAAIHWPLRVRLPLKKDEVPVPTMNNCSFQNERGDEIAVENIDFYFGWGGSRRFLVSRIGEGRALFNKPYDSIKVSANEGDLTIFISRRAF